MITPVFDPGSFRDPAGRVFEAGERIYRTISPTAAAAYEKARDSGVLRRYADAGTLIATTEIDDVGFCLEDNSFAYVVEHPRVPQISYPYEWPFSLLRDAALHHLDFQIDLLADGFVLTDATAYNIQFNGVRPVFVDLLSIREYHEGEYWLGHNQFCEQFLNPLLLRAYLGVPHNDWFRGSLEGIPGAALARLLPLRRKFSLRVLAHVTGPARLQTKSQQSLVAERVKKPLPRNSYLALLKHLRGWIAGLRPHGDPTQWTNYDEFHSYSPHEELAKKEFVERFVREVRPDMLWDLGCNSGEYSEAALRAGAARVVGFDYDQGCLERTAARARDRNLDLLPLYLDGANPSPSQGWAQRERRGLADRRRPDAVVALAFIHHLCIARNVPLFEATDWISGFADRGIIEFVQKTDPTVQTMLSLREDIFADYTEENFIEVLSTSAQIDATHRNPENGRLLVAYRRSGGAQ
jgi:ribosomal protein L11 methylase PrmA